MINRKWVLEKGADGLTFGERLADLMSKKGVKAIDVVKETTISQANFSNYQRDYYKENAPSPQSPKSEVILELARYFDVSADYLLGRVKEKSTDLDTSDICRKTGMEEEIVESMVSATTLSQKLTGADLARDFSTLSKAEQDEQLSCLAAAHKLEIMKFALRWANTFDAQQLEWHLGEACMIADKLKSAGITPPSPYESRFNKIAEDLALEGIYLENVLERRERLFYDLERSFGYFMRMNYVHASKEE